MTARWQLARAGLVNFWYYHDEAEFHFSQGRLILRGSNGSGKSVTMQSFLPLVLDGDKRPWRLDPFGSKDRKIDYYLLLDENSGITDRTGYLYLEFYQPELDCYLTIGIGLRARRNVSGVNFWGFVITDNRRIGKDLFLYEKDYSQGTETKIPLTRSQLEEVIGQGGQVVTEQGEYKRLVNKHLFGFKDLQAYQELLDLLIQLRSPKLSKDFKPSTIYEILTNALPALQEEELRPLSEVMEDMDEISDRLTELSVHHKEAEKLERAYALYNEYLLYNHSQKLVEEGKRLSSQQVKCQDLQQQGEVLAQTLRKQQEQKEALEKALQEAETQLDTLRSSEAVEKEAELSRLQQTEVSLGKEVQSAEQRKAHWQGILQKTAKDKADITGKLVSNRGKQGQLIESMESAARDSEFMLHDVYHRQWEQSTLDEQSWAAWKRDLQGHETSLRAALEKARAEAGMRQRVVEAEQELSNARETRDRSEQDLRRVEQEWEDGLLRHQEKLFAWRKNGQEVVLSDGDFQQVLYLLTQYPQISYEAVAAPAKATFDQRCEQLLDQRAQWTFQKEQHAAQRNEKNRQLQEWMGFKEPEPSRSPAREQTRRKRYEAGQGGAPLYVVCEFREGVSEAVKANLEAALEQAGLLDAWISPGQMGVLGADDEEVWLSANPQFLSHTLADYLYPIPPLGTDLTAEHIDNILRTIQVGDGQGDFATGRVSEQGTFSLGVLEGQACQKVRAQYIGKESRRQTRQEEITRLQEAIDQIDREIQICEQRLTEIAEQEALARAEWARFPDASELYQVYTKVENQRRQFENACLEEEKLHNRYKQVSQQWQEVRDALYQLMQGWQMARNEQAIQQSLEAVRGCREDYSDLKAAWTEALALERSLQEAEAGGQEADEKLTLENDYLMEKNDELRRILAQIKVFREMLESLGIYEIHRQLSELKRKITQLKDSLKTNGELLHKAYGDYRVTLKEIEDSQTSLKQQETGFQVALKAWLKELQRNLVADWQEDITQISIQSDTLDLAKIQQGADEVEQALLRLANRIYKQYRSKFENRNREGITNQLYEVFHQIRQSLHEYSPEQESDQETGRILISFMRDRQNPQAPRHLVKELKETELEQKLLLEEKDRELYEQIIIHSVGKAIKQKIARAETWVKQMNALMQQRETSSGLKLRLRWEPKAARNELELDTAMLVKLLRTDPQLLQDQQINQMVEHFRSRIVWAKRESEENQDSLRHWIEQLLDYRKWFKFTLEYEKGEQTRRELTDARFNVLSGGEKAMAMYIPLFAATYSRYSDSRQDSPKIISLDEAFAGVDDENMRDMFQLITQLDFDFIMTSQVLWGCYDTVPSLSIYEIYRPKDATFVTLIRYFWNGYRRSLVDENFETTPEVAATAEDGHHVQ